MVKRIVFFGLAGSLALLAANSYHVSIYQPTTVNGTVLKRGDFTLELTDTKAVLKQGKTTVEVSVKVETAGQKYQHTQVGYNEDNHEIRDIALGGTTTHLVFQQGPSLTAR